jgi:competence protein ComEA
MQWLSKSRYRGTMLLSSGILLVGLMDFLFSHYRAEAFPEPDRAAEIQMLDSMLAQLKPADADFNEHPIQKTAVKELALRPFNPNTIDCAGWLEMGLPLQAFESLDRYRKKGGIFRRQDQVYKIPHLSKEIAGQMEFLLPPDSGKLAASLCKGQSFKKPKAPYGPFDLNLADSLQLRSVFGIGIKTAARIIRYREDLGGFVRKDQLYEVWGLDSLVAEELMDRSYLSNPAILRKINPNIASEEVLSSHPYIRKGVGRLIVRYRKQHPPFSKPEDLLGIRLFRPEQLEKLKPYLDFQ